MRIRGFALVLVAFLLLPALLTGCNDKKSKYGPKYDPERVKRGIPPIGSEAHTMDDWGTFWNYELGIDKGRYYKRVYVKSGELVGEMDAYKSGQRFTTPNGGQGYEYLQVTYSYDAERRKEHPWSAVHCTETGINTLHSLPEIEELLQSWRVDRLAVGSSRE